MRGYLLRRYKRFLAEVELEDGRVVTAYCPATGRLTSCYRVGAPVEIHRVVNKNRKLNWNWYSIKMPSSWVVIDTRVANRLLADPANHTLLPSGWDQVEWRSEPSLPEGGRLDFYLEPEGIPTWIEVKSVSWATNRIGLFPDAPSRRARRHLLEMEQIARRGERAVLILMAMRSDIDVIRPSRSIDPAFCDRLEQVVESGVELIGLGAEAGPDSLTLTRRIPVVHC